MLFSTNRRRVERLLSPADITIDGHRPWDPRIRDNRFYNRVLAAGSLGLGEAYMDGWWDCRAVDEFINRLLRAEVEQKVVPWKELFGCLMARLWNMQNCSRAYRIGEYHYDIGNDLYQCMLDRRMIYSCGYWRKAADLDAAQEAKLELTGRKLELKPGLRVLDIGCGWGGTACYLAERFGVEVVGITVSEEQARLAKEKCAGLPVEIRLQDYRRLDETFDRVVSVGMFEHVGYKNYRTFMRTVRGILKDDGLFLLHTIGNNRSTNKNDPWIDRYVFPDSMIPSARQITAACEQLFVLEDWHNFGPHYDYTLMQWFRNFKRHWPVLQNHYSQRFYRMWKYYLLSCAGSFRARKNQLWQIVLSPKGVPGGYEAPCKCIPESVSPRQ